MFYQSLLIFKLCIFSYLIKYILDSAGYIKLTALLLLNILDKGNQTQVRSTRRNVDVQLDFLAFANKTVGLTS